MAGLYRHVPMDGNGSWSLLRSVIEPQKRAVPACAETGILLIALQGPCRAPPGRRTLTGIMPETSDHRLSPVLGSVIFLIAAPGMVAGVIPWWISGWHWLPAWLSLEPLRWLGLPLLVIGGLLLIETFMRFAIDGRGTPAPVYPTAELVVSGSYRYVRNPMYLSVAALLLYAALVWLAVHLFVLGYEEPTLRRTYGAQYAAYCAHVRRWLPRLSPWRGGRD